MATAETTAAHTRLISIDALRARLHAAAVDLLRARLKQRRRDIAWLKYL